MTKSIGVDRGHVSSDHYGPHRDGEVSTPAASGPHKVTEKRFTDVPSARAAMESGTHSIWSSEQLEELGHEVIVANVREL